jgi:NADP-dependent 3-hydroxy acid dehydrogenase YdfG
MCTVGVMWLAGIPIADKAVLHLAASRREATAELLERAYNREARIVALDIPDREAILRVLEDCPEEMLD